MELIETQIQADELAEAPQATWKGPGQGIVGQVQVLKTVQTAKTNYHAALNSIVDQV